MDVQARSAGTLSCSGWHLCQDSRTFFTYTSFRSSRSRVLHRICRSYLDCLRPLGASLQHDTKQLVAERRGLCTDCHKQEIADDTHRIAQTAHSLPPRSIARAAGFAAVSIAALLLPSNAHAAELLPLDLFSTFLVSLFQITMLCNEVFNLG